MGSGHIFSVAVHSVTSNFLVHLELKRVKGDLRMPDMDREKQNEFMIEKIKERPVNKKKLIRRTLVTAAMAVIFGLIACFTFLVLEPVINNWLYPEEEPQVVVFPEDQEEMSPEEMLSNSMQSEQEDVSVPENITLEDEQIQEILASVVLDKDNYRELYTSLSNYVGELNRSMVTVTGVNSDVDWFNNVTESKNQSSGVIVADNKKELLILTDYGTIKDAEKHTVTFFNNAQAEAHLKQFDKTTELAILAVNQADISGELLNDGIRLAQLGSSNVKNIIGMPIIALGNPMGTSGSVGYGIVASTSRHLSTVDMNYKLLVTDIYGSQSAGGVLFNLQNEVVGIITDNHSNTDMKNIITAYGISELKKVVEKMSNGSAVAYLGIVGIDVSNEAHTELKVPLGAYVKEVEMDSPAMLAGIQQGDVIVAMNGSNVMNFSEYSTLLMQMEAGQTVNITVMRQVQEEYKEMPFTITLGEVR